MLCGLKNKLRFPDTPNNKWNIDNVNSNLDVEYASSSDIVGGVVGVTPSSLKQSSPDGGVVVVSLNTEITMATSRKTIIRLILKDIFCSRIYYWRDALRDDDVGRSEIADRVVIMRDSF
jgi:hypothetical protein